MRVALAYWSNRLSGGVGTYLASVLPVLRKAGHEVALWHEIDSPCDRPVLPLPEGAPVWSASSLGMRGALEALTKWRPDVLYVHGLREPWVERQVVDIAPAVLFAHEYYGTCISGSKTFQRPTPVPCDRAFGWRCLAEYYPRRCGGMSPVTALRLFRLQRERLSQLSRYAAIATHSGHMRAEYIRQGVDPSRVVNVGFGSSAEGCLDLGRTTPGRAGPWRLLFVGRMDRLKGGAELLRAMPDVARRLNSRLHLTFAGDGPERASWEALAGALQGAELDVTFEGWSTPDRVDELYARSHLLVVPSIWPEPLGLVGLEAARHALPVAAFDVGGISDWLTPGVNGFLASGDPPTVQGLADAIVSCLAEPAVYARLCVSAGDVAAAFSFDAHVTALGRLFERVAGCGHADVRPGGHPVAPGT